MKKGGEEKEMAEDEKSKQREREERMRRRENGQRKKLLLLPLPPAFHYACLDGIETFSSSSVLLCFFRCSILVPTFSL